jgi:chromosome segregation ATPase
MKIKCVELKQKTEDAAISIDDLKAGMSRKDEEIVQLQKQCALFQERAKDRDWLAEKSRTVIAKHQEDMKKLIQHHNERKVLWQTQVEGMQQLELVNSQKGEEIKALQMIVNRAEYELKELRNQTEEMKAEISRLEAEKQESKQMISSEESNERNKKGKLLLHDDAPSIDVMLRKLKSPAKEEFFMDDVSECPHTSSLFDNAMFF